MQFLHSFIQFMKTSKISEIVLSNILSCSNQFYNTEKAMNTAKCLMFDGKLRKYFVDIIRR